MELKTTRAQLAQYFSAWLSWWVRKNTYTQLQAAIRLGVTPGFVNMIVNNKRAASVGQMEKIAKAAKADLLDILFQGCELLHGDKPNPSLKFMKKLDSLSAGLSQEQTEALTAYRGLLLLGGEGVEVITDSILALASKKNGTVSSGTD